MPKVSVIIPVYNAEKYLRQCLDSVLGQSLRDIEVICVDDFSTDGSRDILSEYATEDSRVTYFVNEKNLHAGPCRNKGLSASRGEYVLFLDGDDWVSDKALEKLYTAAIRHKADVIRCRAVDYNNQAGTYSISLHNGLKRVPFFLWDRPLNFREIYWLLPKMCVAPWGGLCRRQFLVENDILFNDLVCVNDRSFYWESVIKADRIVLSKERLVYYRTNMSSSLVGSRIKNFDCHFRSYELVEKHAKSLPIRIQRAIFNAELLDMANWLEQARETEYEETLLKKTRIFIGAIDTKLWRKGVKETPWYRRINENWVMKRGNRGASSKVKG